MNQMASAEPVDHLTLAPAQEPAAAWPPEEVAVGNEPQLYSGSAPKLAPVSDQRLWVAQGDTAPAVKDLKAAETPPPAAEPAAPSGIKMSGWVEQGFTYNADHPDDRQNFGRLFDDRSNDYRLNQMMLTLERPLEPEPGCFGFGWKAQAMYGSDARFTHYLGITDRATNDTVEPALVELWGNFHMPILTPGGLDIKVGHFVTLMGAETIDPNPNPLYSHTYMFNFGIPLVHTGFMGTLHLNDNLDLMAGMTTGVNTGWDDNNDKLGFHGGLTAKMCDGKITLSPTIHVGAENDSILVHEGLAKSSDLRTIVDVVTTIQLCDNLKSITDLNYGHEDAHIGLDGQSPEWYGIAQYLIFTCNEKTDFVARWETWRDDDGFAAYQFAENDDFMDFQRGSGGHIDGRTVSGGDTTYHALTLGVNYKPCENIKFRPEIRWDWANTGKSGVQPFNDSQDDSMFTLGCDVIYSF
jgi:hypothetical protein